MIFLTQNFITNILKVSTKKTKWLKVKAKTVDYFETISIPGVSQIVTTESYLLKLLWIVVILGVFGFGFYNISQSVDDYYKYDVITNIERITPENVTFPAITVCIEPRYLRDHYLNDTLIGEDFGFSNSIENFLDFEWTNFFFSYNISISNVSSHLDTFKINDPFNRFFLDCLRFNGITNKRIELIKASSPLDEFRLSLKRFYKVDVSDNEYYRHFIWGGALFVFIGENSLNSFEKLQNSLLISGRKYDIEIGKESIETKLPEPYNPCKESLINEHYHQRDCIEACFYKGIKDRYNCTFDSTLFSIQGLNQCVRNYRVLKTEFSESCLMECPFENCFSEKFTYSTVSNWPLPDELYKIFVGFQFLFRDLSSLNITQIPKTDGYTFLNNIGGGLGLFMGIAFPNLIEFLQFILEIFLIIFIRKIN